MIWFVEKKGDPLKNHLDIDFVWAFRKKNHELLEWFILKRSAQRAFITYSTEKSATFALSAFSPDCRLHELITVITVNKELGFLIWCPELFMRQCAHVCRRFGNCFQPKQKAKVKREPNEEKDREKLGWKSAESHTIHILWAIRSW